ncbi:MAG: hypothetical protein JNK10_09410 [Cyclobacteriaceae bacterium]|nr:hypothetical protein [Cyclobacteriaceae bacterium]
MKKLAIVLILAGLAGCQNEEPPTQVMLNQLTSGNAKSWKIGDAGLSPTPTDGFSITNLANVNDDEFVFMADPSTPNVVQLKWQIRNQIRASATTAEDALLDYYLSGHTITLTLNSNGTITSDDPNLDISLITDKQISFEYQMGPHRFSFNLVPEPETTFVPATLEFEFLSEITGTAIGLEQAAGFIGSMASNSLYFAYKAFNVTPGVNMERVIRYDIDDGAFTAHDVISTDFVTKELHIINDELKVVGATVVNTYSLDLTSDPVSVPHNLVITRYGSTVVNDNVFLFGGDLNFPIGAPGSTAPNADKIYRHDQISGQLIQVGVLPEPRYWAHGEIVDGKLYVFGGRQAFVPTPDVGEDDIFVHDMASGETQTLKLPTPINRTFAARYRHLIYLAGQRYITNPDPALTVIETVFGVFNTRTQSFTFIPCTLDFTANKTVYGMTIVGDDLFILYGQVGVNVFKIYRTAIGAN